MIFSSPVINMLQRDSSVFVRFSVVVGETVTASRHQTATAGHTRLPVPAAEASQHCRDTWRPGSPHLSREVHIIFIIVQFRVVSTSAFPRSDTDDGDRQLAGASWRRVPVPGPLQSFLVTQSVTADTLPVTGRPRRPPHTAAVWCRDVTVPPHHAQDVITTTPGIPQLSTEQVQSPDDVRRPIKSHRGRGWCFGSQ